MKVYHNPRCRKSRESLQFLEEKGISPEIRLYLEEGLTSAEIKSLLKALDLKASDIVRKTERIFKENYKGKELSESALIKAMVDHPKLLQRPIIIKGKKAVIGRPKENILDLL